MRSALFVTVSLLAACAPDRPLALNAPAPGAQHVRVCGSRRGELVALDGFVDPASGATLVAGQPLDRVFPRAGIAAGKEWFEANEPLTARGQRAVKYGLGGSLKEEWLATPGLRRVGEWQGVEFFEAKTQTRIGCTGAVYYVLVTRGCIFQVYQVEVNCGPVRG